MKINTTRYTLAGIVFIVLCSQTAIAAESAESLYKQCEAKSTTVEQRECYPVVEKQSEAELVAVEKKVRDELIELEQISEGSRSVHPVKAFDNAERVFREFRTAESKRAETSAGSGNGGDLQAHQASIEMTLTRIKQLKEE